MKPRIIKYELNPEYSLATMQMYAGGWLTGWLSYREWANT